MSNPGELFPFARPDCLMRCPGLVAAAQIIDFVDQEDDQLIQAGMKDNPLEGLDAMFPKEFSSLPGFREALSLGTLPPQVSYDMRQGMGNIREFLQAKRQSLIDKAAATCASCLHGPLTMRATQVDTVHTVRVCTAKERKTDHGVEVVWHKTAPKQ